MSALLRRGYGDGPVHLLVTPASIALAAFAFSRIFDGPAPLNVVLWFAGAIVAHDLIAYPLYSLVDRVAFGGGRPGSARAARRSVAQRRVPAGVFVRVPALLSGLALLVYFPLILRLGDGRYERSTGLSPDVYLGRWLAISAGLFLASALVWALRVRRATREEAGARGSGRP